MTNLINVGVPHLGEEAKGRWGVWVINWELDVSLEEKAEADSQHVLQTPKPDFNYF